MKAEIILIVNHDEISRVMEHNEKAESFLLKDVPEEEYMRGTIWFDIKNVTLAHVTVEGFINLHIGDEFWYVNPTEELLEELDRKFCGEQKEQEV